MSSEKLIRLKRRQAILKYLWGAGWVSEDNLKHFLYESRDFPAPFNTVKDDLFYMAKKGMIRKQYSAYKILPYGMRLAEQLKGVAA